MKRFRVGVSQRQRYSWNVHSEEIVEVHNEVKPFVEFGKPKIGLSGRQKDQTPRAERVKLRIVGTTEKMAAKAIKASGNQFVAYNRDGRPIGWYPTAEEAEAKAGEAGYVFDRIEGRNIERRRRDNDIPDPGVYTAQVSEEVAW